MKKIISILSLILTIILITFCIMYSSALNTATLTMTDAYGKVGDEISIDINLEKNPGIITLRVNVTWDERLELIGVSNSELLSGWTEPSPTISSPYTLRWADSLSTTNNANVGKIATLTFKIKESAPVGSCNVTTTFCEARNAKGTEIQFNDTATSLVKVYCDQHSFGDFQPKNENEHERICPICQYVETKNHAYSNDCDTSCDCGYVREITHSYGKYIYNNDATTSKDGTKTRTCSVCGHKETVTAAGTKLQSKNPFTDVKKSDFYYTPVLWAVNNGITSGTSATTFAPNEACTRGQIVTFLWRAAGCPTPKTSKNPFTDVKKSDYYYTAVLWAVENGITSGTSKTAFSPNDACTRGQIAAFLWRAAGSPAPKGNKNPFKDVSKSAYYYKAVLWAVENGITSGTSATTFEPNAACTRGQIVTFLYRSKN